MRVLVTDGNERSALAITRALGQHSIDVVVGAETERSLAAASKYCWGAISYPSPFEDSSGFVASIFDAVRRFQVTAVFPASDGAMSLIAQQRQKFAEHTKLPIPAAAVFESLSNKYSLMQLAVTLGIPVPENVFVPDGRFEGRSKTLPNFPVVVKPGRSILNANGRLRKTRVHYAASKAELARLYAAIDYLRQPSLIQRRVEGEGQGIFALMNHGQPVALFAHRRLREKPPSGGVSVLRESIALPQPMTQYAMRLLQHVGWHGVAMVEFKVDRRTGVPFLMEVNGRFWGSLQLALDAGLNFPLLLYRMACGGDVNLTAAGYKVGVKSRWLLGDLDHLLLRLFKSDAALSLPPDSPTKLKTLIDFCRFFQRNTRYEVNRFDDPNPFCYELRQYLACLLLPTRQVTGNFHYGAGRLV
jgi:predicted ATP-grasp superfamily ATP-dependent carboligase